MAARLVVEENPETMVINSANKNAFTTVLLSPYYRISVSYTHLDVYKRQALYLCRVVKLMTLMMMMN